MTAHMSDESLADLLDAAPDAAADAHLRRCADCRTRFEEARAGLALARTAEVPEPSPLYWQAFQRGVGRRLSQRPRPSRRLAWPAAAALAAALLYVAFPLAPPQAPPAAEPTLPAWSALPAAEDDDGLLILQSVARQLGPDADCQGLEDCVVQLSDEEGDALAEMMRRERSRQSS
jgi:hypothetical protein